MLDLLCKVMGCRMALPCCLKHVGSFHKPVCYSSKHFTAIKISGLNHSTCVRSNNILLQYPAAHDLFENVTDSAVLRATRLSIKLFKNYSFQKFLHITLHVSTNMVILRCCKSLLIYMGAFHGNPRTCCEHR
jgi:hypothetical protein